MNNESHRFQHTASRKQFHNPINKSFCIKSTTVGCTRGMFPGEYTYTVLCCSAYSSITFRSRSQHKQWINRLPKKARKGCSCQEERCCHRPLCGATRRNAWIPEAEAKILFGLRERSVFNRCLCQSTWTSLLSHGKGSTQKSILLEHTAAREEDIRPGIVGQIESGKIGYKGTSYLLLSAIKKRDSNEYFMNNAFRLQTYSSCMFVAIFYSAQ